MQFTKVNYYLHDLVGAKPVLSVSRNYPFNEIIHMFWAMLVKQVKKIF